MSYEINLKCSLSVVKRLSSFHTHMHMRSFVLDHLQPMRACTHKVVLSETQFRLISALVWCAYVTKLMNASD